MKDPSAENINNFNAHRNILKVVLKNAKKQYYMDKFKLNHGNSKATWQCITELMGKTAMTDDSPEQIYDDNHDLVAEDAAQAEIFNEYFSNVGLKLKDKIQSVDMDPTELLPN